MTLDDQDDNPLIVRRKNCLAVASVELWCTGDIPVNKRGENAQVRGEKGTEYLLLCRHGASIETMNPSLHTTLTPFDTTTSQGDQVAEVITRLTQRCPRGVFFLFGSRTKKRAHKYSDWDVGVYAKDLSFKDYLGLIALKDDLTEDLAISIDLVNLNQADPTFIQANRKHLVFLTGPLTDWQEYLETIDGK